MQQLKELLEYFLHIDHELLRYLELYGNYIYAIMFAVIFVETGFVIMPFLPGDSLLFAAGMLAADDNVLNIPTLIIVLWIAAFLGDTLNYHIGKFFGPKVFDRDLKVTIFKKDIYLLRKKYLFQAQEFFEKHGGKAIILARFAPFLRTFVPFIAGVSKMNYGKFLLYNVIGGFAWVAGFSIGGYFLGQFAFVKDNVASFSLGIIFISVMPAAFQFIKAKLSKKKPEDAIEENKETVA